MIIPPDHWEWYEHDGKSYPEGISDGMRVWVETDGGYILRACPRNKLWVHSTPGTTKPFHIVAYTLENMEKSPWI